MITASRKRIAPERVSASETPAAVSGDHDESPLLRSRCTSTDSDCQAARPRSANLEHNGQLL